MFEMNDQALATAAGASADPERVRRFFGLLATAGMVRDPAGLSADQARILAALLSGSPALGNLLVANPDWLEFLEVERLRFPRREQGMRSEVASWLKPLLEGRDYAGALSRLRRFKQQEMLRIAARDLARLGTVLEIIREISDVADVCLSGVWQICQRQWIERFGQPWHRDAADRWQPTEFCVLGMGKLGGRELNYSSDVDVMFVYTEEGQVFKEAPAKGKVPRAVLTTHQYFTRLGEALIAEVSRITPQGMLSRIDLRLRPEGDSGPLCRSLGSYENYYAQWGQTWERMMLIKARPVAGSEGLAAEFLEMIQPFRYPRAINEGVLHEVGAMKDRIENEVLRADELDRNVKLGRGGIREIEFLVQALQLLHAGRQPFLQESQTLPGLEKLAQYNLLSGADAAALRDAYGFLRDVEHRLQMEENLQTHTIPVDQAARKRLARLMGFGSTDEFEAARQAHTGRVRRVFTSRLKSEAAPSAAEAFPREFEGSEDRWKNVLAEHSFRDTNKAFQVLREFVEGPGYMHVSARTIELAHHLLPRLLGLCPKRTGPAQISSPPSSILSDPDRVVTRLDSFITAYGARAVLFELWNSNPAIFELLIRLFDRSEFLAELAIRTPDMVDELVTSGRLRQRKTAAETLRDLRHGLGDADQRLWLRRYHQTELMRIGLRDILGLADFEQYLQELSALADACLQYALEVVLRKHRLKKPPFVVIGLGKLGGAEIDYGSDLDIIFVADPQARNLRKLQQIALEVMDLVSSRTEAGLVFHTDARLRPDGEKGLLVNTLKAYEEYYRQRAQLWEIQSLTRTRPVAGDLKLGERFQILAAALTDFSRDDSKADSRLPVCVTADWKQKIHAMRMRIEKERTPVGKEDLAIKTGSGGLVDAEFVAQVLCLAKGWQEANTLRALERARDAAALPDADQLIANYRPLRRVEGILRRWSYEGETVLPDDPAPFYRVSVRCGFATPEEFRAALAGYRKAIREVYARVFGA
jgi:[glutamine synthetase] adenylyltransferase / [glutamine synthetase]-adenylyl-L-tyrosine phosphorylase